MGEKKVCSSCGASMPVDAVFCPGCGQKQDTQSTEIIQKEFSENSSESISSDVSTASSSTPEQVTDSKTIPDSQDNSYDEMIKQADQLQATRTSAFDDKQPAAPAQSQYTYQQPAQSYPPQYAQPAQQTAPQKPKKKFPWVFTVLWIVMLGFVGLWTYFFMLPGYEKPEITEDTVRVLIYAISVIMLIYSLNIKLITKKFKVVPTILMVIFLLTSFLLFSHYELIDGDFIHDLLSPVTESFLPMP